MRVARLLGTILALLTAGALLAPAGAADPPARLTDYITDNAGVLNSISRGQVWGHVDSLYTDHHIRLWVVYVHDFSGQSPESWARETIRMNYLGDHDALLAVATDDRSYAFLVPTGIKNVSSGQVQELRRNQIEPALHRGDWAGAAVAAADGLGRSTSTNFDWWSLLIALGVVLVVGVVLVLALRYRRRRRRAAELTAARKVDPTDAGALADVPLHALDGLSREMVVDVDNAVRTSTNELALAIEEFGAARTEPFSQAVSAAKAALTQAFNVRQQLDDAIPETPAQRRELLTRVIVAAAKADRELEAQQEAFEQLRDLVINAPSRLDGLTQRLVELTARIPDSEQHLTELRKEFDAAALTSVAGNVSTAGERVSFADRNITRAREVAARPVAGQQSELVDAVRAAEAALGQAGALLDAVDSAASDIRHAVAALPAAITDIEAGIEHAGALLPQGAGSHRTELTAARAAAVTAVDNARRSTDPLGAFMQVTKADADLDRLLAVLAEEQAAAERLNRALEQALFTAGSRVRAVSDYIDTRRGSIGPEARTRLAEASRQLDAAQSRRATDVSSAIAHAHSAATLAAQAQSLAQADAQSAQQAYYGRYGGGDNTGAMLGGIIIGNILSGGMRGGFGGGSGGGWSPTSFGGSDSSGGGFFGGGGRF
ncbi:TPM domain-containing protein [Mycobacterium sp. pUA109]|uniref:TPM domain-containing protein n=1 Tax=Mycobacterium sp. pUA109 TaxID=3238982 RepID=UPI00351ABB83